MNFSIKNKYIKSSMIALAICTLGIMTTHAQPCGPGVGTVLFNEDFEGEADGATSGTDAGGVAWTATCAGCVGGDFFEVDSNSGNATGCNGTQGLRGNDTNGPGVFTATVDLTGCEVVYFGFDYCASGYTGSGNLECVTECAGCSGVPSEGVSNGGCNNCWDFLYGELDWGSGSAQQILLGDDCDAPPNGTTGNAICGSTDADGNPIDPADLTSVDINIVMAMWAGTENMVIDNIMVICYSAAEVAACADPTVADACPIVCPDLTTIIAGDLDVGVTESTCPAGQMTPSGGSITAPAMMCPMGSTLEYSLDNFATAGTTTPPMYDQSNAIMVSTRCVCDDDMTMTSATSTVTTVPGECVMCDPAITAATPAITIDSESTCAMAGGTLAGGAISAATCPTGSTIEYSTDGGGFWSATLPTYDQNNSISVMARCVCDADMTMIGTGMVVTTTPGTCPPPAEVCNACDCTAAPNSYTINTVADNGSQAGYTLTYTLTGNSDPLETDTPAAGAPASFPGLVDNMPYDVCAFNVLDADLAAFQAALTNEAAVADAIAGAGAFMTLCYTQVCVTFPAESCDCCPDISAIMMGEGQICNSGDTANITVDIVGGVGPYTVVYNDGSTNTTLTGYNSAAPITVMPTSNTPGNTIFTYTLVSVTDANGCTSTVAGTGTVTVTMSCANAGSLNGSGN